MKKKLINIFMASCLAVTALIPALTGYAETSEETAQVPGIQTGGDLKENIAVCEEAIELSAEEASSLNERMQEYTAPEESLIRNNADSFYYYEHLESTEKQIYDVLVTVASDPTDINNIGLMMTMEDPFSNEFQYECCRAFFAMLDDHPEFFWLYTMDEVQITWNAEPQSINGIYYVYFSLTEEYDHFEMEMTAFNDAADAFLSEIDQSASSYEITKQIHDRLIQTVTYDHPVADNGWSTDLAHTAYGALVQNSRGDAHYAVCDGYSLAMEYLLQQCGLHTMVVCGDAGENALSAGGHAWNMVELDGQWYELDSTWDDQDELLDYFTPDMEMYSYFMAALQDAEYLEKLYHYLFLISTEEITDYDPDDSFYYTFEDGSYVCLVTRSVHRRWESDGSSNPYFAQKSVYNMAPIAANNYA